MPSDRLPDGNEPTMRVQILDAARTLLLTEGVEAISARQIAKRIGRSPMAIYRHFADMGDILRHLADEGFGLLADAFEASTATDPLERLRAAGRAYIDFAMTHPAYYRAMFSLKDSLKMGELPEDMPHRQRTYNYFIGCVFAGIEAGRVDPEADLETTMFILWSAIHGAASLMQTGRLDDLPPERREHMIERLMEAGIALLTRRPERG